ncbi:cell growth regulator with RING finger domain protein 1-like isoform X3 [Stegodyphus dumicola]|uniref:cell growth regulator with RING finger domain protein 1-like isoform X3 n=1 Tax=Stegodyphus dumicola TaxID=202533 RepID=UPI0015AB0E30|nr:cell growth regulator with RING finger domain protein 1-like isoform X3 [Stegodyphus dumicola]
MEFNITPFLNDVAQHISNRPFLVIMIIIASYLLVRLLMILYRIIVIDSGIHYVTTQRSAVKMDTYHNPFFFDVNIQKANYLAFRLIAGDKKVIEFKPRWDVDESQFETNVPSSRQTYPFVVIMLLQKAANVNQHLVVAMANVVHVSDNLLKFKSQLYGQYVKLSSGPVGSIKKIFLSSPEISHSDGEPFVLCIACYHRAVSPVFLPCRHACVCSVCSEFCKTCPVCRGPAYFYFELLDASRSN